VFVLVFVLKRLLRWAARAPKHFLYEKTEIDAADAAPVAYLKM
jgi:hypothetical protein